ncbi:glycosyltransferase [Gemmobacter denitrificans]|uniref:Glycosyltransferase n=1 Tax=Gemmobacter denitrificans TaxID=3123040 RepID=A0ABU8C068_9RHOB
MIRGNIEAVKGCTIQGWVADDQDWAARLEVCFITRRGRLVRSTANQPRDDLQRAGIGQGQYGFALQLPWPVDFERDGGALVIEVRDAQGTVLRRMSRAWSDIPADPAPLAGPRTRGRLLPLQDGRITGWIAGADPGIVPVVTLDGRPLPGLRFPVELPREMLPRLPGHVFGFALEGRGLVRGGQLALQAQGPQGREMLDDICLETGRPETGFIAQLEAARRIAAQPGAIAITCWDGSHNPIGRAKVLFDVARHRRPAIILSYLHRDFGGTLWPPLMDSDAVLLTLPWEGRHRHEAAIRQSGLRFDTVWISKARLPSFRLAALVSHPRTALMLDFDDNEDQFSRSDHARDRAHGVAALNLAADLAARIPARTAASITLCNDFGALMLRHVRTPPPARPAAMAAPSAALAVGFVGTVRKHKRLIEAAAAVKAFSATTGIAAQLHVLGDISPDSMVQELTQAGVVVGGKVPSGDLATRLAGFDVVLSGFSPEAEDNAVTRYQISSKIGDALAVGKPVLVPQSPSVQDLAHVPGVFLFTPDSFTASLMQALSFSAEIGLPETFTVEGAQVTLETAEALACAAARAGTALAGLDYLADPADPLAGEAGRPVLVLFWKQQDAGLYGRRVDQIARGYRAAHPGHRVIVLEMMHADQEKDLHGLEGRFLSEAGHLLDLAARKRRGHVDRDGVEYRQITYPTDDQAARCLESWLVDEGVLPINTVMVLFPILPVHDRLEPILAAYPQLVDVVDNQILWGSLNDLRRRQRSAQYLRLLDGRAQAVFNSEANLHFFRTAGYLAPETETAIIPNWYQLPAGVRTAPEPDRPQDGLHLLYSGNMNDRIDWDLMARIAALSPALRLHLVGTAARSIGPLLALLESPNVIYHGPLDETQVLALIRHIDLAIMPHLVDEASAYMNPLKVHMFAAMGLPVLATQVPGLGPCPSLHVVGDASAFLAELQAMLHNRPPRCTAPASDTGRRYVALIDGIRQMQAGAVDLCARDVRA